MLEDRDTYKYVCWTDCFLQPVTVPPPPNICQFRLLVMSKLISFCVILLLTTTDVFASPVVRREQ